TTVPTGSVTTSWFHTSPFARRTVYRWFDARFHFVTFARAGSRFRTDSMAGSSMGTGRRLRHVRHRSTGGATHTTQYGCSQYTHRATYSGPTVLPQIAHGWMWPGQ